MTGYHGAVNVMGNNSLGSSTQSIVQMQMANNANVQVLNENISTITAEMRDLCSTLVATPQQLASILSVQQVAAPTTPATVYVPAPAPIYLPAAHVPPPPPPALYATTAVPA